MIPETCACKCNCSVRLGERAARARWQYPYSVLCTRCGGAPKKHGGAKETDSRVPAPPRPPKGT